MTISELQEETLDLDWFALDAKNQIAHFATGGKGFLPASIKSMEDLLVVKEYFRSEATVTGIPMLAAQGKLSADLAGDFRDFLEMASKGLYSFDYVRSSRRPTGYCLMYMPSAPKHCEELPKEIVAILSSTRLSVDLSTCHVIEASDFE